MIDLDTLGRRVCIMGPSNSGKSTLAAAIGRKTGLPVVTLDRMRHEPGAYRVLRPDAVFIEEHAAAVQMADWVLDGNYSLTLKARLARATGLILLDVSTGRSLVRYVGRCLAPQNRQGAPEGAQTDPLSWAMIRHICGPTRLNRLRYRQIAGQSGLPCCILDSPRKTACFYRDNGLVRQAALRD